MAVLRPQEVWVEGIGRDGDAEYGFEGGSGYPHGQGGGSAEGHADRAGTDEVTGNDHDATDDTIKDPPNGRFETFDLRKTKLGTALLGAAVMDDVVAFIFAKVLAVLGSDAGSGGVGSGSSGTSSANDGAGAGGNVSLGAQLGQTIGVTIGLGVFVPLIARFILRPLWVYLFSAPSRPPRGSARSGIAKSKAGANAEATYAGTAAAAPTGNVETSFQAGTDGYNHRHSRVVSRKAQNEELLAPRPTARRIDNIRAVYECISGTDAQAGTAIVMLLLFTSLVVAATWGGTSALYGAYLAGLVLSFLGSLSVDGGSATLDRHAESGTGGDVGAGQSAFRGTEGCDGAASADSGDRERPKSTTELASEHDHSPVSDQASPSPICNSASTSITSALMSHRQGQSSSSAIRNHTTKYPPSPPAPASIPISDLSSPPTHENLFEAAFHTHLAPLLFKLLAPLFFASIGYSIPFLSLWRGEIIWKGVVYALLMALAKVACGVWVVLGTAFAREHAREEGVEGDGEVRKGDVGKERGRGGVGMMDDESGQGGNGDEGDAERGAGANVIPGAGAAGEITADKRVPDLDAPGACVRSSGEYMSAKSIGTRQNVTPDGDPVTLRGDAGTVCDVADGRDRFGLFTPSSGSDSHSLMAARASVLDGCLTPTGRTPTLKMSGQHPTPPSHPVVHTERASMTDRDKSWTERGIKGGIKGGIVLGLGMVARGEIGLL